ALERRWPVLRRQQGDLAFDGEAGVVVMLVPRRRDAVAGEDQLARKGCLDRRRAEKVVAILKLDRLPRCGEGYMAGRRVGASVTERHLLEVRAVARAAAVAVGFELR